MMCVKNACIMRNIDQMEMLTRRDLASRWRVSTETLKRREKAGLLRAVADGIKNDATISWGQLRT